jgi:hypothetical protein
MSSPTSTVLNYTTVNFDQDLLFDGSLVKDGDVYVAQATPPLLVQTPPIYLQDALDGSKTFVSVKAREDLVAFFKAVEEATLNKCLANCNEWFDDDSVSEEAIRSTFKSFVDVPDHIIKLSAPSDITQAFDEEGNELDCSTLQQGTRCRLLVEMRRCVFGQHEWGASWRILQAQLASLPQCLIRPVAKKTLLTATTATAADPPPPPPKKTKKTAAIAQQPPPPPPPAATTTTTTEEEEEEEEPIPAPVEKEKVSQENAEFQ